MSHVDMLKLHSLKATPQRLCVLDVLENHGHVTLEDIEKYTKSKFPTLSLSTIYRIEAEDIIKNAQSYTDDKISNVTISFDAICKECLSAK